MISEFLQTINILYNVDQILFQILFCEKIIGYRVICSNGFIGLQSTFL